MDCAVKSLCRALACFFLELSGLPVWERFVNPVAVSVHPVAAPTDTEIKLFRANDLINTVNGIARESTDTLTRSDDRMALTQILGLTTRR